VADRGSRFKNGRWDANLYQNHSGSSHRDRSGGMHRDTERAMVGNGLAGMEVRNLHHSKQRQQEKAQDRRHRQSI
jgi:hypothetical protein